MAPAAWLGLVCGHGVLGHAGTLGAWVPDAAVHTGPRGVVVSCRVYALHGLRPPLGASALAGPGASAGGAAGCVAAWLVGNCSPCRGAQSLHPIFHSGCRGHAHPSRAAAAGRTGTGWWQELPRDQCWPPAPVKSLQ